MGVVLFANANETATLSNTFTLNNVATDPGTISLAVTDPLGATSTYTFAGAQITRTSAGVYWKEIPVSTAGEWTYLWTGTSPVADANHGSFTVLETNLGRLYATPQMIKSRVGIAATDSSFDYELQGACYAASRAIENDLSRVFWRSTDTRVFDPDPDNPWSLDLGPFNDLVSITSLKVDNDGDGTFESTFTTNDYQLNPNNVNAGPEARPYTAVTRIGGFWPLIYYPGSRDGRIQIIGTWGWPQIPWAIAEASKIYAAELFKMKDAPFGVASVGEMGMIRIRDNLKVVGLIDPYRYGARYAV